jgi:hypothetical protein
MEEQLIAQQTRYEYFSFWPFRKAHRTLFLHEITEEVALKKLVKKTEVNARL